MLSKAMQSLATAAKADADLVIKILREVAAEQEAKLDELDRESAKAGPAKRGFDPETLSTPPAPFDLSSQPTCARQITSGR